MRLSLVLLVVALTACQRGTSSRATRASVSNPAAGRDSFLLDSTCSFLAQKGYPDPGELATEFLRRDAAGQFLQSNAWFNSATTCPGHEPGPDAHTSVASYTTRVINQTDALLQLEVRYAGLGGIEYRSVGGLWQPSFREAPGLIVDTLSVVRTPFGWRVRSPALWRRVLADSDMKRTPFAPRTARRLRFLLDSLRLGSGA